MKNLTLALGLLVAAALPAAADVCELNSKTVTDRAMRHLAVGDAIQQYAKCDICTSALVKVASLDRKASGSNFEIAINGKSIDLANTYVRAQKGAKAWSNLGFLAKCDMKAEDGYKTLPANLVAN